MEEKIDRQKAWDALCKYNKSDALRKHGLAVEGAMRHFAKLYNEDEDIWGIIGLLHDIDYEMYPDEHCAKSQEIMREEGFTESYVRAAALMRPSKSVMDLEVKSVKKKFKAKGFAAGVDRNVILSGCNMIDMELDKVIENTILGMRNVAEDIGL
jgi:Predicted hydrolase (HD superfamily)